MKRSYFYFTAIYVGEEFPESYGGRVIVADDLNESGYVIAFLDGSGEFDNMHDDDLTEYSEIVPVEYLSDYFN